MQTRPGRDRKEEGRQKKARTGLTGLLKRLRKACGSFSSADEWIGFVQEHVQPLLIQHAETLSADARQRIEKATRLVDTSREGINQTCKILQFEVESILLGIPAPVPAPLYQVLLGGLVAAAVVIGAGILVLNEMAASIHIFNKGCEPIDLTAYQIINLAPGIEIPQVIETGSEVVLTLSPVPITIDTRQEKEFTVVAFGIPVTGEIAGLSSIRLDETTEIFGLEFPLSLRPRAEHWLQLICR